MQSQIFLTMYAQLTQHFEFFVGNKFVHKMATHIFLQSKKKMKRPNNNKLLELQQK